MTVTIMLGDVFDRLKDIPDNSVDCVVTSPPYWGLRDYGVAGQIGLEPTLVEHIAIIVAVFREIRRVLKPTGTVWLNYGDCYATTPNGRSAADTKAVGTDDRTFRDKPFSTVQGVLKPKDLCMVPNRLAIALQEDGWWIRSEIIWAKPNPMPESIRDRPATSHEKIFMLTKEPRYFYNADVVRQNRTSTGEYKTPDGCPTRPGSHGSFHKEGREKGSKPIKIRGAIQPHKGLNDKWDNMTKAEQQANGRSLRNYEPAPLEVWVIATKPFKEAHFATFPPELAERCLKAGCPAGGLVLDPFGGAGTVGLVADRMGLDCILIELNHDYAGIADRRISVEQGMFNSVVIDGVMQ